MNVVGALFIKDNKLLLNKPRKRNIYQLIAGKIEDGETPFEAMCREASEELIGVILKNECFEQILEFDEIASSDGVTNIHYYLFKYNGVFDGKLCSSSEIESFLWYDTSISNYEFSPSLNHVIFPYCREMKLIK